MALRKFRSGALKNKYSSPLSSRNEMRFICFSSAKKFLAIFSPALTFSLVLSLVSRQEKERSSSEDSQVVTEEQMFDDSCSFSFARPKENEPKEKGAPRKWFRQLPLSEASRPPIWEAILIYGGLHIADETPKIASLGIVKDPVQGGRNSIFARESSDHREHILLSLYSPFDLRIFVLKCFCPAHSYLYVQIPQGGTFIPKISLIKE